MSTCALFLLYCMGGCIVPSKRWDASDEGVGVPSKSKNLIGCRGLHGRGCEEKVDKVGESCQNSRVDG